MSENTNENQLSSKRSLGTNIVIIWGLLSILLGVILLYVPQITVLVLVYLLCSLLIIAGITCIVRYFITGSYNNIGAYGFSFGALFVILGICALIRADQVASYFITCIGLLILFSSIIKLQNALDLKYLQDKSWIVLLLMAVAITICAILILVNPFSKTEDTHTFTYIILIADGIFGLFINLYLSIRIRQTAKKKLQMEASTSACEQESNTETEEQHEPEETNE